MGRDGDNPDELPEEKNRDNADRKIELLKKSIEFFGENSADKNSGFDQNPALQSKKTMILGSQELSLSYLCENSKLGCPQKEVSGHNLLTSFDNLNGSLKGKEREISEDQNQEDEGSWMEKDFLQLNGHRGNSSKRDVENMETEDDNRGKKPKVESLNLSLSLPDVSLSLARSDGDFPSQLRPSRSLHSLAPSYNNMATTYSNDFTATSLSYSCSHQFSHNPSCSLTMNSGDFCVGSHRREYDQIWNCGEGTNGSVHSRFRPVGDGTVALSNHGGGGGGLRACNQSGFNKDPFNNSIYKMTNSSDNVSFLPSEMLVKPRMDTHSGDSGRNFVGMKGSERIIREIVSESIPDMSPIMQELTDDTILSLKEYLKNIIDSPESRVDLVNLQKKLDRRSDLTTETLSRSHKSQLEILVAIKMGLSSFLNGKNQVPAQELVQIFFLERCRNIICRRSLPVDECDCKICSLKKGFCSECMCPICFNFDCASNTCTWVGCDTCSHWCHATCGLQSNLIKPGPCVTGPAGTTEMQFHCLGCGHASEMFGFVKDVFMSCAKNWGVDALMKELDCVKKIFRCSQDRKGKELHLKADEMLTKLQNKTIIPPEVCLQIFQSFNTADAFLEVGSSRNLVDQRGITPKSSFDLHRNDVKASPLMNDKNVADEWSVKPVKKGNIDSLESLVKIKEAEARMYQTKADEAKRDIENYKRMVRLHIQKLDEEYGEKLAKLRLQETEERRREKMEELKALENSHCDYYKMKIRMQSEISVLLKRMEATKQKLV